MEGKVLGYKSPLFGRRTGQIKMEGFDYLTTLEYFKDSKYSKQDLAIIYAITGGIPLYISLINSKLSVKENIKNLFYLLAGIYLMNHLIC